MYHLPVKSMSELDNEALERSVLSESIAKPSGPKPRNPLSSHLERSILNSTVPHRNITIREKMKESCSANPKGNLHRKSLGLTLSYKENSEEDDLATDSDEDSKYMSIQNESPVIPNVSPHYMGQEGIKTSTPQSSSRRVNTRRFENISYSKHTRTIKCSESFKRTPSPVNGTKQQQPKPTCHGKKSQTSDSSMFSFFKVISCIVLLASVWFFYSNNVTRNIHVEEPPKDSETLIRKLQKSMQHLRNEFHQQDHDTWYDIASAVRDVILNPVKPSMIILFANESNTMNCLARSIAVVTSQLLNSNNYLTLTPDNMGSNLGQIVNTLKPKIEEKPVVIVQDLLNIHPEAIKAFHNLCDREHPLVKKAVYIITMVISGYNKSENPLYFIENQITRKLSALIDTDILMPLTTRLTEGPAIEVQAQKDLNCLSI